jgi:23S rRNA (guanosine2251-2'-O)-methyltransferase
MYSDKRDKQNEEIIAGRNAVYELLKSGNPVDSVLIAKGNAGGPVKRIIDLCRERDVTIKDVSPAKLDGMCGGLNHQGVAAVAAAHEYATVEDILKNAQEKGEVPFILIADEISDPHNLGAMIRTAETAGMHGIIIPKRNAAGLTAAVAKASSGALEYLPVARVSNLVATVEELKKKGIWIYGAEMSGKPFYDVDFSGPAAIVVGSEGSGISRLLLEKCDFVVSIPMRGQISSLNASVAAGILIYQAAKGRKN